ncbi:MAG: 1-pyrroline-5-carboxylate dehydrogenase, partial [Salegentibacter sp.]
MGKGFFQVPIAVNEPVKTYAPGTPEREEVLLTYKDLFNSKTEVPLYIGSEEIKTGDTKSINPPHDHQHEVGTY